MRRFATIAIAALAATAGPAVAQSPEPPDSNPRPSFYGLSADGSHAVFVTAESLAATDTDGQYRDVYVWSAADGVRHVSTGGNGPQHATREHISGHGERVFFATKERLDPADADDGRDLYAWSADGVELISTGPDDPNTGSSWPLFVGASSDGERVLFAQDPPVVAGPGATIFVRQDGTTTRLATDSTDPSRPTEWFGVNALTPDATRVIGTTPAPLSSTDTDSAVDGYEVSTSSSAQVSLGTNADTEPQDVEATHASEDLGHVLLETEQRLEPADTDDFQDVYLRSGGQTRLLSVVPRRSLVDRLLGRNAGDHVWALDISADGSKAIFHTYEKLTPADTDPWRDVYSWTAAGGLELVTTGPADDEYPTHEYGSVSPDGSRVVFGTYGRLTAGDTDDEYDVYERSGGVTRLLTPTSGTTYFHSASRDLTRVFFSTVDRLVAEDTDSFLDTYAVSNGSVELISTGPTDPQAAGISMGGGSGDGSAFAWGTTDPLVAEDEDDPGASDEARHDIYVRSAGVTHLVTPDP